MSPHHTEVVDLTRQYTAAVRELADAQTERLRLIEDCKRRNLPPQPGEFSRNTIRLSIAQDLVNGLRAALRALGGTE